MQEKKKLLEQIKIKLKELEESTALYTKELVHLDEKAKEIVKQQDARFRELIKLEGKREVLEQLLA